MAKTRNIFKKLSSVKLVIFDFDGVFTDNKVIVDEVGKESVVCNRTDGIGLSMLKGIGIDTMILSSEENNVVKQRAKKLKIDCVNACGDKLQELKKQVKKRGLSFEQVAFVGNDINDKKCLEAAGVPIIVANSHPGVLNSAIYKTKLKGGEGAVREVCDLIYLSKKWEKN